MMDRETTSWLSSSIRYARDLVTATQSRAQNIKLCSDNVAQFDAAHRAHAEACRALAELLRAQREYEAGE